MICSIVLLLFIWKRYEKDSLFAYAKAVICWTCYLYFLTEVLSLFKILNRVSLTAGWSIFVIALAVLAFHTFRNSKVIIFDKLKKHCISSTCFLSPEAIALGGMGAITVVLAVLTVPYNWDSMTYHLARIAYWRQNQSVAHYATNIVRQITSPVLAEFVNLHVYVLMNGNDIFLQLLQCFSYITNAVFIYGIAHKLGVKNRLCALAGILFMTMPIAFGESLTTQVDHYSAMWLFFYVYILLDFLDINKKFQNDSIAVVGTLCLSLSVGFGYLAKPSVMFAVLFFAVWLLIVSIKRKDSPVLIFKLLLYAVCALAVLLAPELIRNFKTFHAFSDPSAGQRQLIGRKNPRYVLVNFIKNFVWNLPNIYTGGEERIERFVYRLSDFLKVDINDSGISEDGREFAMRAAQDYNHDTAINPIVGVLFILVILFIVYKILAKRGKKTNRIARGYSLAVSGSFLIFCAVLRWEPFVTRYMIAYLGLLCPMIIWQIQDWQNLSKRKELYFAFLGIIVFVSGVEYLGLLKYHGDIVQYGRQNQDREYGYFYWQPDERYIAYQEVKKCIKENDYKAIGVVFGSDSYDYPLFKMLEHDVDEIRHVNVDNATKVYEDMAFLPDCIVLIDRESTEGMSCHGEDYGEVIKMGEFATVLERNR